MSMPFDIQENISKLAEQSEQTEIDLTNKQIFVTFQKEGIHKYPDAPEGVEFLQYPHRHMFHFRVEIDVFHNDRDIEFILFKRELERLYSDGILELDYKSCEMMADDLADYIYEKYPRRNFVIEISEDGENGAICHYPADEITGVH
jgi:hypothetical protein